MKKIFKIEGMHCNSCAYLIESKIKDKVNSVEVNYAREEAVIDFDENKAPEKEIKKLIEKEGFKISEKEDEQNFHSKSSFDKLGFIFAIASLLILFFAVYFFVKNFIPEIALPQVGDKVGLGLLFVVGILTGFHCISMCGAFVVSYTTKNAQNGHKNYKQHLAYGGAKVISYSIIGGIFGFVGGIIAFSVAVRAGVEIFAGIFMIFYSLSMLGIKFFKKFQFNSKFLARFTMNASASAKGSYARPIITGLLNGLFIACGPLQAMYLYAAGTGSFVGGATALTAFGLGTLPIMIGFGAFASAISKKTTDKILKISAIIVLILGLIMLNRGLSMVGSPYNFSALESKFVGNSSSVSASGIKNGVQEINMEVTGSGYSPNSFVLKQGVPVKWNINVEELTGCNQEIVVNQYGIDKNLKQGLNVIEFTPDKTGTVTFTCGMGMLRGSFVITVDGTASQEQIKQATPPGSSCGCGAK